MCMMRRTSWTTEFGPCSCFCTTFRTLPERSSRSDSVSAFEVMTTMVIMTTGLLISRVVTATDRFVFVAKLTPRITT